MATPEPIRDSILERPLPSSPETERAILGAIILDNTLIAQAVELLKPPDFYVPSHRRIFVAMFALFERGSEINPILVAEELRRDNSLDSSGGVLFLTNLTNGLPHVTSMTQYAKVVRGKSLLRQLVKVANKITAEALEEEDEPQNILDHAEHAIFALADERIRQGFEHIKHPAERVLEKAEAVEHRDLVVTGVATGFRGLDALTSGFQKQDFVVIAARPSMGKTSLALTLAQHAAIENKAVVGIFSLEMSAKARRLATEQKQLDMIVVDYMQLMSGSTRRFESRQQEVSQISRELKALAKELNVPMVALSQLSRAPENRTDHRPQLADLRESGAIEQDADVVAFIYREEQYHKTDENKNIAELIVAKQRNGPTDTVYLAFLNQFARFADLEKDALGTYLSRFDRSKGSPRISRGTD